MLPQTAEEGYMAPPELGQIAYGLEPGVPEPDVNLATVEFVGRLWIATDPNGTVRILAIPEEG